MAKRDLRFRFLYRGILLLITVLLCFGKLSGGETFDISNPISHFNLADFGAIATPTPVSCNGGTDGTITISGATGGTGTFEYSIDNGTNYQSSSVFTGLTANNYTVLIRDIGNPSEIQTISNIIVTQPAVLDATVNSVNINCFGANNGNITISGATGGSGSYEYTINGGSNWSTNTTYSNLSPNTYDVRIRDAANQTCQITLNGSLTITQPAVLNATVNSNNITCFGANNGSITISSPSGGSGSYEYSINGGINWSTNTSYTNLSPNTYDVRIRDAVNPGCQITLNGSLTITQPAVLNATVTPVNANCFGANNGSITISSPSGGSGSYEYSINGGTNWSTNTSYTNLSPNTYDVRIRDGSNQTCQITLNGSLTITQPAVLNATVTSVNVNCFGANNGSITISGATGGSGSYEYTINGGTNWSTNTSYTNLSPNTYDVRIRDAVNPACQITLNGSLTITQPAVLNATVNSNNITCFGTNNGSITISGPSGGSGSYEYSINGGTNWSTNTSYTNLSPNTYDVRIRDAVNPGCQITLNGSLTLTQPTEILFSTPTITDVSCPGLSNGKIVISASGGTGSLTYSITPVVGTQSPAGTFNNLSAQVYTITATDANNCQKTIEVTVGTVPDNTAPTFTPPSNQIISANIDCIYNDHPDYTGRPTNIADNCTQSNLITVSFSDVVNATTPPACRYPFTISRTWTITDQSGNSATHLQTITVMDINPPKITYIPPTKYLQCGENTEPTIPSDFLTATDCSEVTISKVDSEEPGNCFGKKTITRTWTATDCSGLFSTAIQRIEVTDTQAPTVTFPLIDTDGIHRLTEEVQCPEDIPDELDFIPRVIATDNCGGTATVEFVDEEYFGFGNKPGFCPTAVTRRYRVIDNCGNSVIVEHHIGILDDCECAYCVNTPFDYINLTETPVWTSESIARGGKLSHCCPVVPPDDNCVSFFVYLGKDDVGLVFSIIDGAIPSGALYYKINCEGTGNPVGEGVCLTGDAWYSVTFCKPGNNKNIYQIEAIKGVTTADDLTTRLDCQGTITVEGVIPTSVVWRDISNSGFEKYLSPSSGSLTTNFFVPESDKNLVPAYIDYEVCGVVSGSSVCGAAFTDCKIVRVYILPKIEPTLNIEPDKICQDSHPVITPVLDPPDDDYILNWYNSSGTLIHTGPSLNDPAEGDYLLEVIKMDGVLLCNRSEFPFTVAYDLTGPTFLNVPQPLVLDCSDPDKIAKVNAWLATASATYTNAEGIVVNLVPTATYDPIQNLKCGVVEVTFSAADQCNNINTTTSTITIVDNIAPVITSCPADVTNIPNELNKCETSDVVLGTPTATDNCGAVTFTNDAPPVYPVGTTIVTWTATDECGNTSTCTQNVTVVDVQLPTIVCPDDILVTAPTPLCELEAVVIPPPTITENCGNPVLTWVKTGATEDTGTGDVNGTNFNVGITTVTYTITDAANNSATCSFTVTVNDEVPPTIIECPQTSITEYVTAGNCEANVNFIPPTVIDPCGEIFSVTHDSDYGTDEEDPSGTYPVGTHIVTWIFTDRSGNTTTTCVVTVNIIDDIDPEFTVCPPNLTYPADLHQNFKSGVDPIDPVITDNCPGGELTWTLVPPANYASEYTPEELTGTGNYPGPADFYVGVTTITYTYTDANGNTKTCAFTVTITQQPDIECPADITIDAESGRCDATLDPGIPTLLEGGQPITWTWTMTDPENIVTTGGSTTTLANPIPDPISPTSIPFKVGTTTIIWTATNASGSDECTQTIIVEDKEPPTFEAPGPFDLCVENLFAAAYVTTDLQINPDPDYYLLRVESINDNSFDLDPGTFSDNCCVVPMDLFVIRWTILFADIPDPNNQPGGMISHPPISGNNQPSTYFEDIKLWGDGVTFQPVTHTIRYWISDCHGNEVPEPIEREIIIRPRPQIIKN